MLEVFKKQASKHMIGRIVLSIAIIAGVLFLVKDSFFLFIKGAQPITAGMDYEAAEGSYVSFDAKYFMNEYVRETSRKSGSTKETLKNIDYYILFEEDGSFFGVEFPASKEDEITGHIDQTYQYMSEEIDELTETMNLKGTWRAMEGKRLQYYTEQISEDFGEDALVMALPYYIDTNMVGDRAFSAMYLTIAIIAGALLYLVYSLVRFFTGSSGKKIEAYLADHPTVSMANLEADFASAQSVSKTIWVGRRFTFHVAGIYGRVLDNEDLVWGYYYSRTGKHSESTLRLFDSSKHMHALSASEKEATAALKIYGQQCPRMVIGYAKDIEKTYEKDFQGFLAIRYNRTPEENEAEAAAAADPWNFTNPE